MNTPGKVRFSRAAVQPDTAAPGSVDLYAKKLDDAGRVMDSLESSHLDCNAVGRSVQAVLLQLSVQGKGASLRETTRRALLSAAPRVYEKAALPVCPFELVWVYEGKPLQEENLLAMLEDCKRDPAGASAWSDLGRHEAELVYLDAVSRIASCSPVQTCGCFGVSYRLARALASATITDLVKLVAKATPRLQLVDGENDPLQANPFQEALEKLVKFLAAGIDVEPLKRDIVIRILASRAKRLEKGIVGYAPEAPADAETVYALGEHYARQGCTGGVLKEVLMLAPSEDILRCGRNCARVLETKWAPCRRTYRGGLRGRDLKDWVMDAIAVAAGGATNRFLRLRTAQWAAELYIKLECDGAEKPHALLQLITKKALVEPNAGGGVHFPQKVTEEENADE